MTIKRGSNRFVFLSIVKNNGVPTDVNKIKP